ncbi:MAG: hypothetical protein AVDCRST_MAG04-93 [uncultured Acetobacteraceae bacterium]|uniref:Uncharacterized protein n=1 Tax=uncultured Acetobacteraceae bacterium TaxID=169975 RepID=A0A6J4H1D1_9PROT|nr:MAG: hypothetical protein AVDCRST_MAG04-93 [uncultured Acetobacteraceae bacterium]
MVDPTHPLFGRRFRLIGPADPGRPATRARVAHGSGCFLTLARSATNLEPQPDRPCAPPKLSVEALRDLLTVAGEAVAPCRSSPARSGAASRRGSAGRSPATSPRPSGR